MTADQPQEREALDRHSAHELNRLERGRPLTDDEIACYVADHQTALRHATANVGDEIAEQLRDRLAAALPRPAPVDGELARLREAAAPGPWASQATEDQPANALIYGPDGDSFAYLSWNPGNDYDMVATAAFIVAACNYVRDLLVAAPAAPAAPLDVDVLAEALYSLRGEGPPDDWSVAAQLVATAYAAALRARDGA